jgi:hypothetical protein
MEGEGVSLSATWFKIGGGGGGEGGGGGGFGGRVAVGRGEVEGGGSHAPNRVTRAVQK